MKKLTLLIMACCATTMMFAAGGNITYHLNGGVTNDYGWTSKSDMFDAFAHEQRPSGFDWKTLEEYMDMADSFTGTPGLGSGFNTVTILGTNVEKWGWLATYIRAVTEESIATTNPPLGSALTADYTSAAWRYAVSAFFVNKRFTGWPNTADFTLAGQPAAFIPTWGHAFAGPATYDGETEIVLPNPYKEGDSFAGWYETADFSSPRVRSIPVGATGDKVYYAKYGEYIPECAEVWAMAAGTTTKATGVVTFVNSTSAYVQDATAGMFIEFASAPGVNIGDEIVVSGTTATVDGRVKITAATLEGADALTLPSAQTISLAALIADVSNTYMYKLVYIEGLNITAYTGGVATLSDGANTIALNIAISQTEFPVGTKVNVKATVAYNTALQLVGTVANVTKAPLAGTDPFTYPVRNDVYKLTNNWLVSSRLGNLSANQVHSASQMVRGMIAKEGKMYFIDSNLEQLTIVDAAGNKLAPLKLDSEIFATCEKPVSGSYPINDLKQDNAGNVLLSNGVTSGTKPFEVWKIDLATGKGTLIVSKAFGEDPDYAGIALRFDAFGVYGDVDGDAIIMAANASAMEAYKWTVTGGVAGEVELIVIDNVTDGTGLTGLLNPGTAPQIFPLNEDLFYLDGNATYPTVIDMDGFVIDGFFDLSDGSTLSVLTDEITRPGTELTMNEGHNGILDFQIGDEHFMVMAATNTARAPYSSFRLYKFANGYKEFKDMEILWTFPIDGMGGESNPYRTAVPSVEVDEEAGIATIYVYTGENGYGVYEFQIIKSENSVKEIINNNAVNVSVVGNTVQFNKEVASVSVFSITGQAVANSTRVSSIDVNGNGVYIVKVKTYDGETAVKKVIVK